MPGKILVLPGFVKRRPARASWFRRSARPGWLQGSAPAGRGALDRLVEAAHERPRRDPALAEAAGEVEARVVEEALREAEARVGLDVAGVFRLDDLAQA